MNFADESTTGLVDHTPTVDAFLNDVLDGLSGPEKTLPCKYFYDARGSQLFDQICELEEYYLTRTELAILEENVADIAAALGPRAMVIEPGSGSSLKTRLLLDHLNEPAAYVPVDISRDHLIEAAAELNKRYPDLEVCPVSADFTEPFGLPVPERTPQRCAVYFPGSTIGNFDPDGAVALLQQFAELSGDAGSLVIGIDLQKDANVLEAAYDDAAGVTAAFNLNILDRINQQLDADFDLDNFRHRAIYNAGAGRIEMYLESLRAHAVTIGDDAVPFREGECICTEYSHKYTVDGFAQLAEAAGFRLAHQWLDEREYFAVLLLETAPDRGLTRFATAD